MWTEQLKDASTIWIDAQWADPAQLPEPLADVSQAFAVYDPDQTRWWDSLTRKWVRAYSMRRVQEIFRSTSRAQLSSWIGKELPLLRLAASAEHPDTDVIEADAADRTASSLKKAWFGSWT